jgi:hypothetical protein
MNHRDDGFFPNDRFSIDEPVLDLRVNLIVDHLVRQVGDEELDVAQQLVAGVAIGGTEKVGFSNAEYILTHETRKS